MGIGTLAGVYGGVLKAEEVIGNPHSVMTAYSSGGGVDPAWGVNAVVLKSPWKDVPSVDDMLADRGHTLSLSRFYRVGGENLPATPTECRIAHNSVALFILFRCTEDDMSFPSANLDANVWPEADWYARRGLPSGPTGLQSNWPPNPDEVDFLIQPDKDVPSYYQFAATPQGLTFGCSRSLAPNNDVTADESAAVRHSLVRPSKVEAFKASVARKTNEWLAFFQIPWQTLGGKPKSQFGFLPMRTRWRDGQFSSPVAIDINEGMPVDLLIETHFPGSAQVANSQSSLCQLPSGILRWQRPALSAYPSAETCQQIWQMESSLTTPTDKKNLAQRLFLTQRWMDLMMQEGFTPLPRAWGVIENDLTLALFRQKVNAALRKNDSERAYQLVDTYLSQLDKMSHWWYADGSPGNLLNEEWKPVTSADNMEAQGKTLLMQCLADGHKVDLRLVLPSAGGVRIYGRDEGYWRPADLLPLTANMTSDSCSIDTADGKVVIHRRPFTISFYDLTGVEVTQIGANGLAFRFGPNGQILAVDFKHRLDQGEAIYGFGEKYDRFNQNGNVLTLWGTDDWVGNGVGTANTTYKPLPVFHSSRAYMVFSNSSYRLRADIGKTDPSQCRLTQLGPILDYYFWFGTPANSLHSYTALTGRTPLPPKWAFEPWMGRGGGAWASGQLHDAVAEEQSVTKRFAELDIPHSAIYAEGPSALSPDLNEFMAARGIRVLGYFMPAIGLSRQKSHMPSLNPNELPILHCGTEDQTRTLGYVDFTNPNAMELCRQELRQALDLGEAGSMVDYGDLVPDDATFYDGEHGAEMHNFYYYDYQRTVSEVFREKRGNDFILYSRGAAPGTQRWVGQFAGDHPANFNGLKHVLTGALNLCACGYSNWGSDLGGYFGFPQPAVYMRWFQFGCFSPLMRPHGTAPREPWYFGEAAVSNYKFLAWTRENILNYTYNAAAIAHETGTPIMRSMPVAFPDEGHLAAVPDQYMFGPDLLVAPVVNEDTFRTILFPSGVWTSLWDGKTVSGPATLKVDAPLDTIPVYLKPGAVVPVQLNRELQFGRSMTSSHVNALVVTSPNENEKTSLLNACGELAKVAVQSKAGGFCWMIENLPEMSYLLVYGTASAASVTVDGKVLPNVTTANLESMPIGWATDLAGNRLVIHLPSRQIEHSEPITEIEIDFNPSNGFRTLQVDAGKIAGNIHSLLGVNGAPFPVMAGLPNLVRQYSDLRISQVRTHDLMGPADIDSKFVYTNQELTDLIPDPAQRAGVVKAGNASIIFPDMSADPDKPESYNFGPTDKALAAIRASGAEIYYRVGRSYGADFSPPDDFDKYANVVKHIAMHYNQGWANGFHYQIRYWEFWNEPEGFWTGTPEQFYSLYEKTARALKSTDPTLKVGGNGQEAPYGYGPYRDGFFDYCAAHKLPLDFYSWHHYARTSDPYDAVRLARQIRGVLDAHGFPKAESILSEWNLKADYTKAAKAELEGAHNAAYIGAVLCYGQDAPLDKAHFYRGDAAWMGLFDLQGQYFKIAYTFKAMGKMPDTPQRLAVEGTDTFGFAALAGRSTDDKTVQIFIANYAIPDRLLAKMHTAASAQTPDRRGRIWLPHRTDIVYRDNAGYDLTVSNLPWGEKAFSLKRHRISATQNLELVERKSGNRGSMRLSHPLPTDTVELIVLERE